MRAEVRISVKSKRIEGIFTGESLENSESD